MPSMVELLLYFSLAPLSLSLSSFLYIFVRLSTVHARILEILEDTKRDTVAPQDGQPEPIPPNQQPLGNKICDNFHHIVLPRFSFLQLFTDLQQHCITDTHTHTTNLKHRCDRNVGPCRICRFVIMKSP